MRRVMKNVVMIIFIVVGVAANVATAIVTVYIFKKYINYEAEEYQVPVARKGWKSENGWVPDGYVRDKEGVLIPYLPPLPSTYTARSIADKDENSSKAKAETELTMKKGQAPDEVSKRGLWIPEYLQQQPAVPLLPSKDGN